MSGAKKVQRRTAGWINRPAEYVEIRPYVVIDAKWTLNATPRYMYARAMWLEEQDLAFYTTVAECESITEAAELAKALNILKG
jgi:hypothetical protein